MHIQIDDIFDPEKTPFTEITRLGEHLLRFRLATPRRITAYHQLFLAGQSDTSTIFPEAPNREGIRQNFESMSRKIIECFEANRDAPFVEFTSTASPKDLLLRNIEHFCRPDFLFTNGQSLISLVIHAPHRISAVRHNSPWDGEYFSSDYMPHTLLDPARASVFGDEQAADMWIRRELSKLSLQAVPIRRGHERRSLLLQHAGTHVAKGGGRGEVWFGYLGAHERRLERAPGQEPYSFYNKLDMEGFRAETCATCIHFRFSGMSRDMSAGAMGYCWPRHERAGESGLVRVGVDVRPSFGTVVSVGDTCGGHCFVEDKDRPRPYGL